MPPSARVRVTAKAKQGPCDQCPDDILKGERHVTVIQTFGKSKAGKTKYKAVKVHFTCLAKWLICEDLRYSTRKKEKGGRPEGSGLQLPDSDKKERRHLVRTRARLMRLVMATEDEELITVLGERIGFVQQQIVALGGPLNENLMHRSPELRKAISAKLRRVGRHA
ncbi:hypothetical protein LCGC14_2419450 [marine sediment metagenome]|uniref:PARP-type domain-containing protein n=1 Tax=marine sediment metagenome TaxID=412755 RepID=A0A0F9BQ45_9ZZZZ